MQLQINYQVYKNLNIEPLDLFAHLTQAGSVVGCSYFAINDQSSPYFGYTIGVCQSSLSVQGKAENFSYQALTLDGEKLLTEFASQLSFTQNLEVSQTKISGQLFADLNQPEFEARLAALNHRHLIEKLIAAIPENNLPIGAFGCFAFDFIKQIETLPSTTDDLNDPDYCFYLPEKIFMYDQKQQLLHLIQLHANSVFSSDFFAHCEKYFKQDFIYPAFTANHFACDIDFENHQQKFSAIKEEIVAGNVFQLVFGTGFSGDFSGHPLTVFKQLTSINPSDFMFYFHDAQGVLLGCSPENCLRVKKQAQERIAELTPLAGTVTRSKETELDQKLMIHLITNSKELAEHSMLIDLARNDLCSIAKTGSVKVQEAYKIKTYSTLQHIASRISAVLRADLTPLQAYQATMNMGTLTGSPKPRALQLIANYENQSRGYFGGSFAMFNQDCMESCIVIRSLRIKNHKVYLRAASGIVLDSQVESEWNEIHLKAKSCINALNPC